MNDTVKRDAHSGDSVQLAEVARTGEIQGGIEQAKEVLEALCGVEERLAVIDSRVFGSEDPRVVGADVADRPGEIGNLRDLLDRIGSGVGRIRDIVVQLDKM